MSRVSSEDFSLPQQGDLEQENAWLCGSTIFGFNSQGGAGPEDLNTLWEPEIVNDSRLRLAASVFDNTRDGIMVTDTAGLIVDVNRAFVRITGYQPDEVIGKSPNILKSERHPLEFYEAMWANLRSMGVWRGEIWNRRKSGEIFVQLVSVSAVRNVQREVTHYVAIYTDITALKESQQRLEYLAYHDALTQLPNRVLLADRIRQAMLSARRRNTLIAVCFADLDHFKPINDTYGHEVGDLLLVEVASRFRAAMRDGDTVARLGGDEFALLLGDLESQREAEEILLRLLEAVALPYQLPGEIQASISVSIGYTVVPFDACDPDSLLRHADQAMYQAKLEGRNKVHCFDLATDQAVRHRQENVVRLKGALLSNEFRLFYQPKVDMRHGMVVGCEALIRWQHPERGLLQPGEFLGPLGNHGLLAEIGDWVVGEALRQMRAWQAQGLKISVSVNLSPNHLLRPDFVGRLRQHLAEYPDVDPGYLEFEILESAALEDIHHVSRLITECRGLGVEFALDDFGTGYSSLLYLKRLPARTLKVDQSFVRDILDTPEGAETIAGIVTLAGAFRRRVVAEGMESVEQGIALLRLRCDIVQGYGISRPMAGDALPGWIAGFVPDPAWKSSIDVPWRKSDFPLLAAEVEQRRWREVVRATVEAGTELPRQHENSNLRESRFGRWLAGLGGARYANLAEFRAIPPIYTQVYRASAEIGMWLAKGDVVQAKELLAGFMRDSNQLSAALVALRLAAARQREAPAKEFRQSQWGALS